MNTSNEKSTATILHLSTLSQYFIPFGNFIFPLIIWSAKKDSSDYIDRQGRHVVNFQLSLFLYSLSLAAIAIPIIIINVLRGLEFDYVSDYGSEIMAQQADISTLSNAVVCAIVAVILIMMLKVFEFFMIIYAAVKTSNGADFKYPLTIPFLKKKELSQAEATPEPVA